MTLLEYFKFEKEPFSKEIDTANLYPSSQHQELYARLTYVIQSRCIGLVTGEVGSGKSTAVRSIASKLDQSKYLFIYISNSNLNPKSFYRDFLMEFGVEPAYLVSEAKRQFDSIIIDFYKNQNKQFVIAIDEVDLLSDAMIHEIKFLSNFQIDSLSPISLLLIGQPQLRARLRLKMFEAIAQRVNVRFHLSGLSPEETKGYIKHHLQVVGGRRELFSDDAVKLIHNFTHGIPRMINNICVGCLLDTMIRQSEIVDPSSTERVYQEMQQM
jgi:general secretion pathway protein A